MIFDTIQLQPYDGTYPQKALIKIFVDTAADLPALADFTDIAPVCGSLAETVDTGDRYRLDSSGTWHLQPQGIFQNVYTKTETDALLAGKQDTLTFDAVPTENSTKPVESGGIWAPLADLVDSGAKNCCFYDGVGRSSTYGTSYTDNGVTYTMNADGSISTSGTAGTGGSYIMLFLGGSYGSVNAYCDGLHVLSGSSAHAKIRARANSTNVYLEEDSGSGAILTATAYTGNIFLSIRVIEGEDATGETVYPMICKKSAWDISHVYVPYSPTNADLYALIKSYHP